MQSLERSANYLHLCLQEFPEICRQKYGVVFDLASVEDKVRHLRRRTPLTYDDLRYFESPEHWWFQRFWVFPPREQIEPALKKEVFDFWNLPDSHEAETIRRLLHIFKSIELVSIILRFIRPEHYSIYSSPIRHMLDILQGKDPVETYRSYLDNLRAIKEHHQFERVADLDMALWVLHEKCYGRYRSPETMDAYREDDFMLQLRVSNLVAPLAALSEAKLARALIAAKPDVASLIACHYFEKLLRQLADIFQLAEIKPDSTLEEVIEAFPHFGPVNSVRKALWKSLKSIRNDLMHAGQIPGPKESQLLLEEITRLESELSAGIHLNIN